MQNNNQLLAKTAALWSEITELRKRLDSAKKPDSKDVERLSQLAPAIPGFLSLACSATASIRQQLLEKISHGANRALLLGETNALAKQLGYDTAPPLERLLIDFILTARLRLIAMENTYNRVVVNQPVTFKSGKYWDDRLTTAQMRYLRAIETLARVRRLERNTPTFQINIAREGGQQVNVQGEVDGQKGAAPAN